MRLLMIGVAFLAASVATPASAQFVGSIREVPGARGGGIRGDILRDRPGDPAVGERWQTARETRSIRDSIRSARDAGQISRSEARALRRESYRIDAAGSRYARDGLSGPEQAMLQSRVEALRTTTVATRTRALQRK